MLPPLRSTYLQPPAHHLGRRVPSWLSDVLACCCIVGELLVGRQHHAIVVSVPCVWSYLLQLLQYVLLHDCAHLLQRGAAYAYVSLSHNECLRILDDPCTPSNCDSLLLTPQDCHDHGDDQALDLLCGAHVELQEPAEPGALGLISHLLVALSHVVRDVFHDLLHQLLLHALWERNHVLGSSNL